VALRRLGLDADAGRGAGVLPRRASSPSARRWVGIEAAYEELFVNNYDPDTTKTVILVTDGLLSV